MAMLIFTFIQHMEGGEGGRMVISPRSRIDSDLHSKPYVIKSVRE